MVDLRRFRLGGKRAKVAGRRLRESMHWWFTSASAFWIDQKCYERLHKSNGTNLWLLISLQRWSQAIWLDSSSIEVNGRPLLANRDSEHCSFSRLRCFSPSAWVTRFSSEISLGVIQFNRRIDDWWLDDIMQTGFGNEELGALPGGWLRKGAMQITKDNNKGMNKWAWNRTHNNLISFPISDTYLR